MLWLKIFPVKIICLNLNTFASHINNNNMAANLQLSVLERELKHMDLLSLYGALCNPYHLSY